MSANFGVWVAAFFTMAIYSYLYREENILFEFAEQTFIGVSAAHFLLEGYHNVVKVALEPLREGRLIWLIPISLGVLLYTRYLPKQVSWLSRLPVAVLVSVAAAAQVRGAIHAEFISQIAATASLDIGKPANLVFLIGVITVVTHFLYLSGVRKVPFIRVSGKVGRHFIMVAFGASLGTTVMARYSLLIGRFQFLFGEWIRLIK